MTTYWDYIRVDDLLRLQNGLEDDDAKISNHEVLFITVHQVYELWFKVVLRELITLRDLFNEPVPEREIPAACRSIDRVTTVLRVAVSHFEVMETLNTRDYLDFRDKLFPASGFQSAQMRRIEDLLGIKDEHRDHEYFKQVEGLKAAGAFKAPPPPGVTLKQALGEWLHRTPIRGSTAGRDGDDEVVDEFLAWYQQTVDGDDAFFAPEDRRERRIRAAILFIEAYHELHLLEWPHRVLTGFLNLEQAFVMFRQRHARMVERVIGRRVGTGGSSGVDYLDRTASYRVFNDLWAARGLLLKKSDIPPLPDEIRTQYEFSESF